METLECWVPEPRKIKKKDYAQVFAGYEYSLGLGSNGKVYSWGSNSQGQLGINIYGGQSLLPVLIPSLSKIIQVSGGDEFCLALTSSGKVYSWGSNSHGQLGIGINGGQSLVPVLIPSLSNIVQISGGAYHCLALASNGKVYSWGNNAAGQLGIGTDEKSNVPVLIPSLSKIIQVSAGGDFSLALTSNGKVYSWGSNQYGQLGIGINTIESFVPVLIPSLFNIVEISTGGYTCSALTRNGKVYSWGINFSGQLGIGSYQEESFVPVLIPSLSKIIQVSRGYSNCLALARNGKFYSWGDNTFGQLGIGTDISSSRVPLLIPSLSKIIQVSCGGNNHCLVLTSNDKVYSWGSNQYGQLGTGTQDDSNVPILTKLIL